MSPTAIEDRLTHRARVLRVRWHAAGDLLLKAGKFVEFTDQLLRLMRQLDAIDAAVAHLTQAGRSSWLGGMDAIQSISAHSRTERPSRRPVGGIV